MIVLQDSCFSHFLKNKCRLLFIISRFLIKHKSKNVSLNFIPKYNYFLQLVIVMARLQVATWTWICIAVPVAVVTVSTARTTLTDLTVLTANQTTSEMPMEIVSRVNAIHWVSCDL